MNHMRITKESYKQRSIRITWNPNKNHLHTQINSYICSNKSAYIKIREIRGLDQDCYGELAKLSSKHNPQALQETQKGSARPGVLVDNPS